MDELIQEHIVARETVGQLVEAGAMYAQVKSQSLEEIKTCLGELVCFYPLELWKWR